MKISELAEKSGVSVRTIRYYTQIGLLPEVEKNGKEKDYPENYIEHIKIIKQLQTEYLPLSAIKEKLENEPISIKNDKEIIQEEVFTIQSSSATIYKLTDTITLSILGNKKNISRKT